MSMYAEAISDVFDRGATLELTLAEEVDAIARAKAGDSDAFVLLMRTYGPFLRSVAGRYYASLGREEARQAALSAFWESTMIADEGARLATAIVRSSGDVRSPREALYAEYLAATGQVSVPEASMRRFRRIMRAAEFDPTRAYAMLDDERMSKETFLAILDATTAWGSTDEHDGSRDATRATPDYRSLWGDGGVDEENALLARLAFDAVDETEETVCRMHYGFTDYEPIPDAEIGARLGLSRPKVQRTRAAALVKMRTALGVA